MILSLFFGKDLVFFITLGILLYGWLGEYIALMKDHAIKLDKLSPFEQVKLAHARNCLIQDVQAKSGYDISKFNFYMIRSDDLNAYSYGVNSIAITQGLLQSVDDLTLNAILAHELSHAFHLDALFNRIIFADITICLLILSAVSFLSMFMIWFIFIIVGSFSIFSYFLTSGISKFVKGMIVFLQRIVLFVYQTVLGAIQRHFEYRSDHYAVELGYGHSLAYFLKIFILPNETNYKSISEILYNSHPATYKRIERIENDISLQTHHLQKFI